MELKFFQRDVISGSISEEGDKFTALFMNKKYTFIVTDIIASGVVMCTFEEDE